MQAPEISHLINELLHPLWEERSNALSKCLTEDSLPPKLLQVICEIFVTSHRTSDPEARKTRLLCIGALGMFGKGAPEIQDLLIRFYQERFAHMFVREKRAYQEVFIQLGQVSFPLIFALLPKVHLPIRIHLLQTLREIDGLGQTDASVLHQMLLQRDLPTRCEVLQTMAALHIQDEIVLSTAQNMFQRGDLERQAATEALCTMGRAASPIMDWMLTQLDLQMTPYQENVHQVLLALEPLPASSHKKLLKYLERAKIHHQKWLLLLTKTELPPEEHISCLLTLLMKHAQLASLITASIFEFEKEPDRWFALLRMLFSGEPNKERALAIKAFLENWPRDDLNKVVALQYAGHCLEEWPTFYRMAVGIKKLEEKYL